MHYPWQMQRQPNKIYLPHLYIFVNQQNLSEVQKKNCGCVLGEILVFKQLPIAKFLPPISSLYSWHLDLNLESSRQPGKPGAVRQHAFRRTWPFGIVINFRANRIADSLLQCSSELAKEVLEKQRSISLCTSGSRGFSSHN